MYFILLHQGIIYDVNYATLKGSLHSRHVEIFRKNPLFIGMRLPEAKDVQGIGKRFPRVSSYALEMINVSLNKHKIKFYFI